MPFESKLPWEILGTLPEMFQTVYGSLVLALKLQNGESLLIRGGSSSIDLMAAQMGKAIGAEVVATTRNPESREELLKNGADLVLIDNGNILEKIQGLTPDRIDKALELVGTNTLPDTLRCVKPGGMVCFTGMLSENWSFVDFTPMDFIPSTVGLTTYDSGAVRVQATLFQEFILQIEHGLILPVIAKVFPLEEIVAAHRLMESNQANGKIVIRM